MNEYNVYAEETYNMSEKLDRILSPPKKRYAPMHLITETSIRGIKIGDLLSYKGKNKIAEEGVVWNDGVIKKFVSRKKNLKISFRTQSVARNYGVGNNSIETSVARRLVNDMTVVSDSLLEDCEERKVDMKRTQATGIDLRLQLGGIGMFLRYEERAEVCGVLKSVLHARYERRLQGSSLQERVVNAEVGSISVDEVDVRKVLLGNAKGNRSENEYIREMISIGVFRQNRGREYKAVRKFT